MRLSRYINGLVRMELLRDSNQAAWQRQTNRVIYTAHTVETHNVTHLATAGQFNLQITLRVTVAFISIRSTFLSNF